MGIRYFFLCQSTLRLCKMAHLVTVFVFTFYAVIQANTKSVKIAENTFLKAKRQQYTLGKVVHCLFNINLYHIVGDILLLYRDGSRIFLGGGALVSCSTSTPISHIFFFAEYQLY